MEQHLPSIVALHPYGRVVGRGVGGRDVVGRQCGSFTERGYVEVAHCGCDRFGIIVSRTDHRRDRRLRFLSVTGGLTLTNFDLVKRCRVS